MKIYNLTLDTSKPINKIVQMQQNSEGVLSVSVANDGKYIRNLSCQMFDGEDEISAIADGDNSFGYKIDVGDTPKAVKVVAKSTPYESTCEYIAVKGEGTRISTAGFVVAQLKPGVYHQDEFLPLLKIVPNFGHKLTLNLNSMSSANFQTIILEPSNQQQIRFRDRAGTPLSPDTLLTVSAETNAGVTISYRSGATLSSITYPSVGYWTDYSYDTTIMPTTDAHPFAERDIEA